MIENLDRLASILPPPLPLAAPAPLQLPPGGWQNPTVSMRLPLFPGADNFRPDQVAILLDIGVIQLTTQTHPRSSF